MQRSGRTVGRFAIAVAAVVAGGNLAAQAPAPTTTSTSAPKVRELAALMKAKNLEAYATRDSSAPNRYVAVRLVPDVQLLLVSAAHSRTSDLEYWMYQKDYANAYRELSTGTLASERFIVQDIISDGLVAVPAKSGVSDIVTINATRTSFDGFADPKKRNDTRPAREAYMKTFEEADQRYATMLDMVIAELRK